jgi:hypothetical protein
MSVSSRLADMGSKFSTLAYHYKKAEDKKLAIEIIEKAASIAEKTYSFEVNHFI